MESVLVDFLSKIPGLPTDMEDRRRICIDGNYRCARISEIVGCAFDLYHSCYPRYCYDAWGTEDSFPNQYANIHGSCMKESKVSSLYSDITLLET